MEVAPAGEPGPSVDVREDPRELLDLAVEPGLLAQLANRGDIRVLTEFDAAARQRPGPDIDLDRGQAGKEDAATLMA